jgi:hypothetical protein
MAVQRVFRILIFIVTPFRSIRVLGSGLDAA